MREDISVLPYRGVKENIFEKEDIISDVIKYIEEFEDMLIPNTFGF